MLLALFNASQKMGLFELLTLGKYAIPTHLEFLPQIMSHRAFYHFWGDTNVSPFFSHTLMSQVSHYTHLCVSLWKTTRFAYFNFLNITTALYTSQNILTWTFFACYASHLYAHFQMQSLERKIPLDSPWKELFELFPRMSAIVLRTRIPFTKRWLIFLLCEGLVW